MENPKDKMSEWERFDKVMDGLLSVSYKELQKELAKDRRKKARKKQLRKKKDQNDKS